MKDYPVDKADSPAVFSTPHGIGDSWDAFRLVDHRFLVELQLTKLSRSITMLHSLDLESLIQGPGGEISDQID